VTHHARVRGDRKGPGVGHHLCPVRQGGLTVKSSGGVEMAALPRSVVGKAEGVAEPGTVLKEIGLDVWKSVQKRGELGG